MTPLMLVAHAADNTALKSQLAEGAAIDAPHPPTAATSPLMVFRSLKKVPDASQPANSNFARGTAVTVSASSLVVALRNSSWRWRIRRHVR